MKLHTLAVAFALLIASGNAHADERRVATLAPVGSPWMTILERGAVAISKATEGRIEIKYYGGGTQGDEKDVVRKMKLKQLDGAALSTVGLSKVYGGIRVLQLPFMFETEKEMAYVRKKMWPYFRKKFKAKGYRLGSPGGAGWEYFYTKREISTLKDLRKVKMWVWTDDPVIKGFFEELELNAIPLGIPDLLGGLKTGRVNGCYGPPLGAVALQWYNEFTHVSEMPISYTLGASVVRYDLWDAASDEDKKAEKKVSRKLTRKVNKRVSKDNQRALNAMKKVGIKMSKPSEKLEKQLRVAAEKTWKKLAGDVYSEEELEMVLKHREDFRANDKEE